MAKKKKISSSNKICVIDGIYRCEKCKKMCYVQDTKKYPTCCRCKMMYLCPIPIHSDDERKCEHMHD